MRAERRDRRTACDRRAASSTRRTVAAATIAPVAVVDRVDRGRARRVSIEDARIIVSGGRGVGGPEGFELVEAARRGARRRRRGDPRGRGLGLDPVRPADRPDRQDRQAAAVPRARHQRRHPAQGRDADRRGHRGRQSRSGRADRRLRRRDRRRATCSRSAGRCSTSFALGRAERRSRGRATHERRRGPPAAAPAFVVAGRRDGHRPAPGGPDRGARPARSRVSGRRPRPRRADRHVRSTGATERIDAVRRGQQAADTIGETITAATDAVERYVEEARDLDGPAGALSIRDDIVAELERAGRALAMVEHGTTILAQVRRRGRELEAQTSIKRGYLNLLHAREAIDRHAVRAEDLRARRATRRPSGAAHHRARAAFLTTPSSGILGSHHKW